MCFSSLSVPTRCDSWSNSERSLEQASFDDVFVDGPQPLPSGNLACPSRSGNSSQEAPSTRPQAALIWTRDVNGPSRDHFSLPVLETSLNSTVQRDQNQASLPYGVKGLDVMSNTPPPRPPKPSHLSERRHEEQLPCGGPSGIKKPEGTVVPRRISLSGLDNMRTWKGKCQMLNFGTETSLAPLSSLCPHEDVVQRPSLRPAQCPGRVRPRLEVHTPSSSPHSPAPHPPRRERCTWVPVDAARSQIPGPLSCPCPHAGVCLQPLRDPLGTEGGVFCLSWAQFHPFPFTCRLSAEVGDHTSCLYFSTIQSASSIIPPDMFFPNSTWLK